MEGQNVRWSPRSEFLTSACLPTLEWVQAPMWVFDVDRRRVCWANASGLALWNAASIEELSTRDFSDMSEAAVSRYRAYLRQPSTHQAVREQWTLFPQGRPLTLSVSRTAIVLEDGRLGCLQEARTVEGVDPVLLRGVEALHHTAVRVCLFRVDGVAVMRNAAAIETFGSVESDGKADDFAAMFGDELEAKCAREVLEAGGVYAAEVQLHTLQGPHWYMLDARQVRDPVSGELAILANGRDIHDRKRTEEALRRSLEAQKRFLASISHEIRTPLGGVIGFVELLHRTELDGAQRQYVDHALVSARHLLDLINDVLDVSKLEAGQIEIGNEEFDIEEVLRECSAIVSSRVAEGVELVVRLSPVEHLMVGDPMRVRQIILNLLGNAAKFTSAGRVLLILHSVPVAGSDAGRLTIEVRDTGIGIPEDKLSMLFAPFRQAHAGQMGGTGLGLYLSRALAHLMRGDIEVESKLGQGSRFVVNLRLGVGARKAERWPFAGMTLLVAVGPHLEALLHHGLECGSARVITSSATRSVDVVRVASDLGTPMDVAVLELARFADTATALVRLLRELSPDVLVVGIGETTEPQAFDILLPVTVGFSTVAQRVHERIKNRDSQPEQDVRSVSFESIEPPRRSSSGEFLAALPISVGLSVAEHPVRPSVSRTSALGRLRVLLVEDVELNVILMCEIFRTHYGARLDVARDGLEAIERVSALTYDVVLMDLQMPGIDGMETTRRLRALGHRVPVVAMTAHAFSDAAQEALAAGMDGYLTKPIRVPDLQRVLMRYAGSVPPSREFRQVRDSAIELEQTAARTLDVAMTEPSGLSPTRKSLGHEVG